MLASGLAGSRDGRAIPAATLDASERIDRLIAELVDWRGATLATVRKAIRDADPAIVEEWKWMGSPVWSRDGMIAVGNAHKDKVKLTFMHGAALADPDKVFNAGQTGGKWRAIDLFEGDQVRAGALTKLVRAAIAHNQSKLNKTRKTKTPKRAATPRARPTRGRPPRRRRGSRARP